jgi:aspartate/methionine/tyrosine aminotransferase
MINRVRLVGAVPRLAPLRVVEGWWRLDLDALRAAVTDRTRVIFINNASFPTGWVGSHEEWVAITDLVINRDLRLLFWAAYEGVLFDGRRVIHPAAFHGMRDRTVTIGDTLDRRMIAWRVAWVVAPGRVARRSMWFTQTTKGNIASINDAGVITEAKTVKGSEPFGITVAPDGNPWYSMISANKIATLQLR